MMNHNSARRRNRQLALRNRTFVWRMVGSAYLDNIIGYDDVQCVNQIRMDRRTFHYLCQMLRDHGRVKLDGVVTMEEQVCMFLHILAHHVKNCTIGSRFCRSGETISRYFNSILHGVLRLQGRLLKVPEPIPNAYPDPKWSWFENCLGALDGTYINVHVPERDKPRYRSRKGEIATNMLGVCNLDMNFIFVYPGWEGSASDSRVLRDAISRPMGLKVPTGMESEQSSQPKGSRRVWKQYEEDALLSILEEAVVKNLRCDNGCFKPGTMAQFETAINLKCPNANIKAVPHIESKMRRWKKDYAIVYDMVNKTGFAWNDVRKCIEVDSIDVWQSYVKVNKEAEGWLGKSFPLYDRLSVIFGKDRATGVGAATPIEMMNEPEHINEDEDEVETSSPSVARRSSSSSTRKRKRDANDNDLAVAFNEMLSKSVDKLGSVLQAVFGKGVDPKHEIASDLSKMDLSIEDQIKALNILFEKPQNERTFLTLDGAMKKAFVLMLLGQSNRN